MNQQTGLPSDFRAPAPPPPLLSAIPLRLQNDLTRSGENWRGVPSQIAAR